MLPIRTSNERIIIPKLQLNPNFWNLIGKRKLVRKIGYFEKSGVAKIAVSDWEEGNDFCFELSGGSKKWGFEKSGFYCSYVSWNLAYSLTLIDCLVKSKHIKETVNSSSYVRFKKILKLLFVEQLKTALFRTTTKKSTTSDKSVEAFQCSFQFCAMQPSCPKGTNSPPPLHP